MSMLSKKYFFVVVGLISLISGLVLIKKTQQPATPTITINSMPGMIGDRSRRYTVSMLTTPQQVLPKQDVTIRFKVYDASNGAPISLYRFLYEKQMHFIIVNERLSYFSHIHPQLDADGFVITTQFPESEVYHLYISFQPYPAIEQQFAFSLPVGTYQMRGSHYSPDSSSPKVFGDYTVSVKSNAPLVASVMTLGQQQITFTITDTKTGKPRTDIRRYLGSFGHLTMINEKTYDFIHVHPAYIVQGNNQTAGPSVDFLPFGLYGPFKSGVYRAFAEFNIDDAIHTFDFTMEVK